MTKEELEDHEYEKVLVDTDTTANFGYKELDQEETLGETTQPKKK